MGPQMRWETMFPMERCVSEVTIHDLGALRFQRGLAILSTPHLFEYPKIDVGACRCSRMLLVQGYLSMTYYH
jgi:hypothetical protein